MINVSSGALNKQLCMSIFMTGNNNPTIDEFVCSLRVFFLFFNVLQEAILTTLEAAASHSVIPRTFSGNSLVAEIHLQIFLVSPFFVSGEAVMG